MRISNHDKNNDGLISFEEFVMLVLAEQRKIQAMANERDEQWRSIFNSIDKDGSGYLNKVEFIKFWYQIEPTMPKPAIELLFAVTDNDVSGKISYTEFAAMLNFIH